jgi:hypothetical protein
VSNNWKSFPNLSWRRRSEPESSVSVNERLARLPSNDLLDRAESSLVMASRELLHARGLGTDLGQYDWYLDRSLTAARQAYEALQVVASRS